MSRKHCCCGACKVCQFGGQSTYQITPAGISGSGGPCPCSTYEATLPLTPSGFDVALPAYITDALDGGHNCQYSTLPNTCEVDLLTGVYCRAIIYQNDSGGVSAYAYVEFFEVGMALPFPRILEGTAVVDGAHDRINCATLDVTVPVSKTSGGSSVYCSDPTSVRIEAV